MPVLIEGATSADSITLLGRGTISTEVARPDSTNLIVPWLIASDIVTDARCESSDGRIRPILLHPLADDQRLVGFAGVPPDAGQLLFGSTRIVPVQLDESRPLLEPAEAWESLDAVVLSASAAARIDEAHRSTLLAGGTIIAVRADHPPDNRWPWKLRGGYWILQYAPAGPAQMIDPDAYTPTYGWDRGWPASFRRGMLVAAVLYCILSLATLLWRSRWTALAFVGVNLVFIAGSAVWYSRQSPILQMALAVRVESAGISQVDLWMWQSTVRSTESSMPFFGQMHPFPGTLKRIESTGLRLVCRPDGRAGSFVFHLEPAQSMAFLARRLHTALPMPSLSPASDGQADFASRLYLGPHDSIAGEYSARVSAAGDPLPITVVRGRTPGG